MKTIILNTVSSFDSLFTSFETIQKIMKRLCIFYFKKTFNWVTFNLLYEDIQVDRQTIIVTNIYLYNNAPENMCILYIAFQSCNGTFSHCYFPNKVFPRI